jgi:hypothetical protein
LFKGEKKAGNVKYYATMKTRIPVSFLGLSLTPFVLFCSLIGGKLERKNTQHSPHPPPALTVADKQSNKFFNKHIEL